MVDRIPSGTRDFLPDEMRELRAMTERVREVFERAGYGEVYTPALEYEGTFDRANMHASRPAYRMFDEHGHVLVLRSDMTVPIARLVSTRYRDAEPPLRFCYFAHAYRGVRPQRGQSREFLQAGIELIGATSPHGTAEVVSVLCAALDAAGLETYRVGLGDASLYPTLLDGLGVDPDRRERILTELVDGDFVGLEHEVRSLGVDSAAAELLLRAPQTRGGPEVLEDLEGPLHDAVTGMRAVHALLAPNVAERIIFDLGLVRSLGYYTGAIFQVYDPAYGVPIGIGGRYDELLGQFGRPLPGRRVRAQRRAPPHRADQRGTRPGSPTMSDLRIAVPRGALFNGTLDLLDRLGLNTRDVRDNDRKLLFEDAGIITMRPSDVPTYVEAGAADLGITGKDVLMEQSERELYELVDLAYGHCTMVLATVAGEDPAAEALRRLGVVRIATKYPRVATRYFLDTGRQAEIVEVKGSVELAPLTGLVEGIVDLTASGTTLRENGLVVREEIARSTARLIANPVAHKLKAPSIDALLERLDAM